MPNPNDVEVKVVVTKDGDQVTEEWTPEAMSLAANNVDTSEEQPEE